LLQENALKGEVLISQQTCDVVADYFDVERLAPRKQKERYDFDAMYRVIGVKAR
jgi:class 3 adenylate cyclase